MITDGLRRQRVLVITAGLSVAGAVCGALAGAVGITLALVLTERVELAHALDPFVLIFVGSIGAVLGAFAAPALTWLLLRRVPLGKAFLHGTLGATLGGVLGWMLPLFSLQMPSALLGALAGSVFASMVLHDRQAAVSRPRLNGIDCRRELPAHPGRRLHRPAVRR